MANLAVKFAPGATEWNGTPCEIAPGETGAQGYKYANGTTAHRAAWIKTHGPLTRTQLVCHHCDNRECINMLHLFIGTHKDNGNDCVSKGRWGGAAPKGHKKREGHGDKQRVAQFTSRMRECECGMKTNAGSMAKHINASGHRMVPRG